MFNTKHNTKPEAKMKYKPKETFSQTLMNYETIRDKVQTEFKPTHVPVLETKKPQGKKKMINFFKI